jgi:hypothetical protein
MNKLASTLALVGFFSFVTRPARAEGCRFDEVCGGPGGSGGKGAPTGPVPVRHSHVSVDPFEVEAYIDHADVERLLATGGDESEVLGIFTAINGDAPAAAIWLGQMAGLTSSRFHDVVNTDYGNGIIIHFWYAFGGVFSFEAW